MASHPKRKPRDGMDEYGRSPFINAIIDAEYSKAKQLLAAGADVNLQDDGGCTALFCAVQNQNIDMIEHLLKNGADVNIKDKKGAFALTYAVHDTRMNADLDATVMEILLANGAEIDEHIANWAKWILGGEITGGCTSPKKEAVIAVLAKNFTKPKPDWA
jgi:ankyrin repeat protein